MLLQDWIKANHGVFTERDFGFLIKAALGGPAACLVARDYYLGNKNLYYLEKIKYLYAAGVPLAYCLSREEFFGLRFEVNPCVLIPRPETEIIVERAAETIKKHRLKDILDLCCGCGNIAISLKKIKSDVSVFASDISEDALSLAAKNAKRHRVDINFVSGNLFSGFEFCTFDLIVSNPPYVDPFQICGSLCYEPRTALCGGRKGFDIIKRIIFEAPAYLKKDGFIIIEVGYNHKEMVDSLVDSLPDYRQREWVKDYAGHFRAIILSV